MRPGGIKNAPEKVTSKLTKTITEIVTIMLANSFTRMVRAIIILTTDQRQYILGWGWGGVNQWITIFIL